MKTIDAAKGRWLNNGAWVLVIIFIGGLILQFAYTKKDVEANAAALDKKADLHDLNLTAAKIDENSEQIKQNQILSQDNKQHIAVQSAKRDEQFKNIQASLSRIEKLLKIELASNKSYEDPL
jgi:hypothetical protein